VKKDLKDWSITKELALNRRVKTSNSCVKILIFGSFSFIVFLSIFFFSFIPFHFFVAYCFIPFFCLVLLPLVFYLVLFHSSFDVSIFILVMVSSLACFNLIGTKMLDCCFTCVKGQKGILLGT
jgi:hypothetical protein